MKLHIWLLLAGVATMAFVGCGRSHDHDTDFVPGPTTTVVAPAPSPTEQDNVNEVVSEVNQQRFAQGQTLLQSGLICSLYQPASFSAFLSTPAPVLGSAVASWTYSGAIYQDDAPVTDGLNVLPYALRIQPQYQSNYAVICSGQIVATTSDYEAFTLRSDDAGLLYVDNVLVVNNDGLHAPATVGGTRFMTRGIHSVQVKYYQASGQESLQLNVNGIYFYH